MLLNAIITFMGWLAFNAIRISTASDDEFEKPGELTWAGLGHWSSQYAIRNVFNWIASLAVCPIIFYFGYRGLSIPDFGSGELQWSDAFYPGCGVLTELLIYLYRKWVPKQKITAVFIVFMFLFVGQGMAQQLTDEQLKNEVASKISGQQLAPQRVATILNQIIDSKANTQSPVTQGEFTADIPVVLGPGESLGPYTNGETIPAAGLTCQEVIELLARSYINPTFSAFSVTGMPTTVEVGTTLSGSQVFTWTIAQGSGVVSTLDIYDNTGAAVLLAGTLNDGSQSVTITTRQLNTTGATQSWRGTGNNSAPSGTFNSSNFVVTARFYRFFGPTSSSPATSAAVRALQSFSFHSGASTFTLNTGSTNTKFVVALPPSVTISSVVDASALNANITANYVLTGTVSVTDAGGTARAYNVYEMNIAAPYSTNHAHTITTSN